MERSAEMNEVLAGQRRWMVAPADCLAFLAALPADSASLVFGSPPYAQARTYSIGWDCAGQDWVDWMVEVCRASLRVCTGLVAFVVEGQTKRYRWTAEPALLMADLHRAGVNLRRPCIYHRVGIPGSGGPDWLRADTEFIVCATRPGRLPWSDNTACGHPPQWAPGSATSHRRADGTRAHTKRRRGRENGQTKGFHQPHGAIEQQSYVPPALANPGNVMACVVGGGSIGSPLAHENEAPFPEDLAAFFVRSFCPPGGLTVDCFAGSGTTGAVAIRWGRRFLGCDLRESQVALAQRRIAGETPDLFAGRSDGHGDTVTR